MKIRKATPKDSVALAKIHIDSWRSAYKGLVPDAHLNKLDYEVRAQRFRAALSQNKEDTYVVEHYDQLLGFLTLGACRDNDLDKAKTGEIWGIYLAPEFYRKGIGSQLYQFGEKLLKERGFTSIVLWVFAGNNSARRFYEAMGFETDGASTTLNPGKLLKAVRYRKEF